jgi:hypothetical protein
MKEIALHLLDLAENSISAKAKTVRIDVREDFRTNQLTATVEDDGEGMSAEMVKQVVDPFFTSRTTRKVGLGIPLLKASAEAALGGMKITSKPSAGTRIEATFRHSHIDRMPLGDLPCTILTLTLAHPEIHWIFTYAYTPPYKGQMRKFEFDDQPLKEAVSGLPLTHPDVLAYLRATMQDGIAGTRE